MNKVFKKNKCSYKDSGLGRRATTRKMKNLIREFDLFKEWECCDDYISSADVVDSISTKLLEGTIDCGSISAIPDNLWERVNILKNKATVENGF